MQELFLKLPILFCQNFCQISPEKKICLLFEYIFRKVYKCKDPLKECPLDVQNYQKCTVEMGTLLLEHFDYVKWPKYLHTILEHVQQLVEDPNGPGSVGAFSSEGNEAGDRLVRHLRKNISRRGNTYLCEALTPT